MPPIVNHFGLIELFLLASFCVWWFGPRHW